MKGESVGDRLKKFRKLKGLKQSDIARELGVRNNTVSQWENNKNGIDIDYIVPICNMLGITPSMLIGYDEDPSQLKNLLTDKENHILTLYNSLSVFTQDYLMSIIEFLENFDKSKIEPITAEKVEKVEELEEEILDQYLKAASGGENATQEDFDEADKIVEELRSTIGSGTE